jgi:hypothetical protein
MHPQPLAQTRARRMGHPLFLTACSKTEQAAENFEGERL